MIGVHTKGFGKFWEVMVIENALFQDPEILEKRVFSIWLWKGFGFLFGKIPEISKRDCNIIQNIIHQKFYHWSSKIVLLGFKMQTNENEFLGFESLVTWLWKIVDNFLEEVCAHSVMML